MVVRVGDGDGGLGGGGGISFLSVTNLLLVPTTGFSHAWEKGPFRRITSQNATAATAKITTTTTKTELETN